MLKRGAIIVKDDDTGLGVLTLLALGGLIACAVHNKSNSQDDEEDKQILPQKKHRKNPMCKFEDGISEAGFAALATDVAKRIKRIKSVYISGAVIRGNVESQSGISTWKFSLDFNDHGHITSRYWIESDNDDSGIPNRLGELISEQLVPILCAASGGEHEDSFYKDTDYYSENRKKAPFFNLIAKHLTHIIILVALCIVGFFTYALHQHSKLVPVGIDSSSLIAQEYNAAQSILTEHGFTNISLNETPDLAYHNREKSGRVISVSIAKSNTFVSTDKFPYDAKVIISYHGLKPVSAPISSKEAKGSPYTDIQASFSDAGFVNITLEAIPDITVGIFNQDGDVESVTVDGDDKYSESNQYQPDAPVVIRYHTLLRNKHSK